MRPSRSSSISLPSRAVAPVLLCARQRAAAAAGMLSVQLPASAAAACCAATRALARPAAPRRVAGSQLLPHPGSGGALAWRARLCGCTPAAAASARRAPPRAAASAALARARAARLPLAPSAGAFAGASGRRARPCAWAAAAKAGDVAAAEVTGVTPAVVPKLKVAELREALARLGAATDGAPLP